MNFQQNSSLKSIYKLNAIPIKILAESVSTWQIHLESYLEEQSKETCLSRH